MLDKKGLATQDVKLPVYHFNAAGEFTALLFIKIEIGTGLPGQSTLVPILEMKDGFTQVFNEEKQQWGYVVDHRYKTAYDINTKQELEIDYFGELKEEHTLLVPPSLDHDFINGKWVITEERKKELEQLDQLNSLNVKRSELDAVNQEITMLERITDRSEDEEAELQELNAKSVALFREIKALEKSID